MEGNTSLVYDIIYRLMVSALGDPGAEVVYVDGCVSMNPNRIARLCRRHGCDVRDVLARIGVSRAFTAYQLNTLLEHMLEDELPGASLLVIQGMKCLYRDDDVRPEEAAALLKRAFSRVRELVRRHGPVTVVTDVRRRGKRDPCPRMADLSHRHITFESRRRGLRIRDPAAGVEADYAPLPWYQMIMDEFGEV